MEKGPQMGMNKTGVQMSPMDIDRMVSDIEASSTGATNGAGIAAVRTGYITEAEPVGSVPMPGTIKGAATTAAHKLTGSNPEVLLDAVGARLAFERAGVRLYDTFLTKYRAMSEKQPAIAVGRLEQFRNEELEHFALLVDCIRTLGADPTAETPQADVTGIESMGPMKVLQDPRTTLAQTLHALLVIELADNDSWELLIKLAKDAGQEDMAGRFRAALQQEQAHLRQVKDWHEQIVRGQAT